MGKTEQLYIKMVEWDKGYPNLIQHFTKVHDYSMLIGRAEGLDEKTLALLEAESLMHDIGILPARAKFGDGHGKNQEKVSDGPVREMLTPMGYDPEFIDRVAYVICHHHTYTDIDAMDYQILVEADFLVNLFEQDEPKSACLSAREKIFKTETGKHLLDMMFCNAREE